MSQNQKYAAKREAKYAEGKQGTWDSTEGFRATIDTTASSKAINTISINKKEDISGKGSRSESKSK